MCGRLSAASSPDACGLQPLWTYLASTTNLAAILRAAFLMRNREIQPRRQNQVILLRARWRIRHINVRELILPPQPLADLRHGNRVKLSSILPGVRHVRKEIELLGDHRALPRLVHQFFAQRERDESVGYAVRDESRRNRGRSDLRPIGISFVSVVEASKKIYHGGVRLDRVVPETAAVHAAQIEVLQRIAHEVRAHESE